MKTDWKHIYECVTPNEVEHTINAKIMKAFETSVPLKILPRSHFSLKFRKQSIRNKSRKNIAHEKWKHRGSLFYHLEFLNLHKIIKKNLGEWYKKS